MGQAEEKGGGALGGGRILPQEDILKNNLRAVIGLQIHDGVEIKANRKHAKRNVNPTRPAERFQAHARLISPPRPSSFRR